MKVHMAPEEGVTVSVWGQEGGLPGGGGDLTAECLPTEYERPRRSELSGISKERSVSWWEPAGGLVQCTIHVKKSAHVTCLAQ